MKTQRFIRALTCGLVCLAGCANITRGIHENYAVEMKKPYFSDTTKIIIYSPGKNTGSIYFYDYMGDGNIDRIDLHLRGEKNPLKEFVSLQKGQEIYAQLKKVAEEKEK